MNKKASELLYRSFDGELSKQERRQLKDALADSPELREERERIAAMRDSIASSAARSFRPFFAERVMHRITSLGKARNGAQQFLESLQFVFRRVAVVGATAILVLVAYNFIRSGEISVAGAFGLPQGTLEEILESPFNATLEELL
jgi:anti-sigma factor RsiW